VSDREKQLTRLNFVNHELRRLIDHPGLFPSQVVHVRFAALMGADSELQLTQACKDLLVAEQIQKLQEISRKQWTRRTFADGTLGWENFLLDGAIGTTFKVQKTMPKSAFQIIPTVGMRIVGDYEREEQEIVRFVQQVSGKDGSSLNLANILSHRYPLTYRLPRPP
jgi:hypothetical protein